MQNNKPIEINADCQFMSDLNNNSKMARYNLIVVKANLKLYSKGIKPNRHFRLKDIKRYFGITGNTEALINKINTIDKVIQDVIKNDGDLTNKGGCDDE